MHGLLGVQQESLTLKLGVRLCESSSGLLATQKSRTGVFSLPSDARKRVKINRAFFVQIHLLLSQMIQISIGDTFQNHVNQQLKSVNKKAIICK